MQFSPHVLDFKHTFNFSLATLIKLAHCKNFIVRICNHLPSQAHH